MATTPVLNALDLEPAVATSPLTCGEWQVEDGRCGDPAVATRLDTEWGICAGCLASMLEYRSGFRAPAR